MRHNTDCTIYHREVIAGAESWTRQVVRDVMWQNAKAANIASTGLLEADSANIYIPLAKGEINPVVGDVIVCGAVTDEISSVFTMSDLKRKYADVLSIRSVDRQDFGSTSMHHWQVGAK